MKLHQLQELSSNKDSINFKNLCDAMKCKKGSNCPGITECPTISKIIKSKRPVLLK
jgi:hypothetical protein